MSASGNALLSALAVGPSFLFLGQQSTSFELGYDSHLARAFTGVLDTRPGTSLAPLEGLDAAMRSDFYGRLAEESGNVEPAAWLQEVARHPWNGVFTTRIDTEVDNAFRAEWRTVVPTATIKTARHSRSTTELRVCHLFGGVALAPDAQPPLNLLEQASRRRLARENLAELTRTLITPRGVIVIDGFAADDWLSPEDLFAALSDLRPGQAHLFSTADGDISDFYLRSAVEQGLLVAHSESLSSFLSEAESTGELQRPLSSREERNRLLRIGARHVDLDRHTWNSVIGSARPIDDTAWTPYSRVSKAVEYDRFRTFLGNSDTAPPWMAIASGYNFRRDFETGLEARVSEQLIAPNIPVPLIVSGQTATGKSIALMALGLAVARRGDAAVLHISKRGERPSVSALDGFALWAEEQGAPSTLVVWDGMNDSDDYFSLHKQLQARGRRVLIVGTTYVSRSGRLKHAINAPAELSDAEQTRLIAWLGAFGIEATISEQRDSSLLAALYRLLPESRRRLERGLNLEIRSTEESLVRRALAITADERWTTPLSVMADALIRAGYEPELFLSADDATISLNETAFVGRSTAEQLTSVVMVAGRHGLSIPLALVLRVLGRDGSLAIIEALKDFDIVRWSADDNGEQYLGARTALEAELLAIADLAGPPAELEVVASLVREVRQVPWGGGGPEVQFLIDVFSRIGPQSNDSDRYLPFMLPVLDAFDDLRNSGQETHHRLALTHGNLLREFVLWGQRTANVEPPERLAMLERGQEILEQALDGLGDAGGRARLSLLVELASNLGAQAYEMTAVAGADLLGLVQRIVDVTSSARAVDPENYYPVDVIAWVTERVIDRQVLSEKERAGLLASSLASLDSIEPQDLSPKQRARYDSRLAQFGRLQNDVVLEESHLQALRENNDPAAFYLLARKKLDPDGSGWNADGVHEALTLLREAPVAVRSDWRCAGLLLDLFWWEKTGRRFLRGERETVAFSFQDWEECLEIGQVIIQVSTYDEYRLRFLRGLAHFHLRAYRASELEFEELDRLTVGISRRVIATYLASNESGDPLEFDGQVRHVTPDNRRGRVWIDQLGIELPFVPYRFAAEPPRRGDSLALLRVAFNMRGAYADPARVSGQRRHS